MATRSTKPDYAYFLTLAYWTEVEIILILGIADQDGFREIVRRSRKSEKKTELKFVIKDGEYCCDPLTVIEWAITKGLTLPIELTDWYSRQDAIYIPSSSTPLQSEEKPLTESTRAIMLRIMFCMAMDSYKYDPDSDTNIATGSKSGSIKAAMQKYGLDVDNKTLSNYLKEAANQNPAARPRKT